MRRATADKQLDVNIVPTDRRRKQILMADTDSTIITSESLDDLAALVGLADADADAVTAITKRAMAGEIDFESALFARVSMLAGKSSRLFDQLIAPVTPTSGAIELVHTMRANGANAILCQVDLTSSPAQLPRFAVFMTITPTICICAIAKFWARFERQFSMAMPTPFIFHIIVNLSLIHI